MHLRDVVTSIDLIDQFATGFDYTAYEIVLKTKSAVERQLQILTEAAIRLGPGADELCPAPDRSGLRGMGNFLRHVYHRVDDQIVWDTVKKELPPLRVAVIQALAHHKKDTSL